MVTTLMVVLTRREKTDMTMGGGSNVVWYGLRQTLARLKTLTG
jgi:hypothetical protein